MKYQFKLEAVRRLRQFEEEQGQQALADAQRILEDERSILTELTLSRTRAEEEFNHKVERGEPASQAAMYRSYLQRLSADIKAQSDKVSKAEKVCEEKRNALLTAMKKRKALDKLKERGEQAFLEQLNSQEMKFINEMAINRFTLKQK
jgi:flagellar FliJ protein